MPDNNKQAVDEASEYICFVKGDKCGKLAAQFTLISEKWDLLTSGPKNIANNEAYFEGIYEEY